MVARPHGSADDIVVDIPGCDLTVSDELPARELISMLKTRTRQNAPTILSSVPRIAGCDNTGARPDIDA
jgi:hypothetical protein